MTSERVFLGLGSNLGGRKQHLQFAIGELAETIGVDVERISPVYESTPHKLDHQEQVPDFLNAVVEVAALTDPAALLRRMQAIEAAAGRDPTAPPWSPRPLDIDILTFGEQQIASQRLTVPHPRLAERRFVLKPWSDLAPDLRVPPPFGCTVVELLRRCADTASIQHHPTELYLPD